MRPARFGGSDTNITRLFAQQRLVSRSCRAGRPPGRLWHHRASVAATDAVDTCVSPPFGRPVPPQSPQCRSAAWSSWLPSPASPRRDPDPSARRARRAHDLPGKPPTVLAPTALAFTAAIIDDRIPIAVGFRLVVGHHLEAHRLVRRHAAAAIQTDEVLAEDGKLDDQLAVLLTAGIIGRGLKHCPTWLSGNVAA